MPPLIILLMALIASSAQGSLQCPEGEGCDICTRFIDNYYSITCGTTSSSEFSVKFQPYGNVRIHCYQSPSWAEFHLGKIRKIDNAQSISFLGCRLPPNGELFSIAKQLIESDVQELIFRGHHQFRIVFKNSSLAGFEHIRRLSLNGLNLNRLPADLLSNFSELESLEIRNTGITELPDQLLHKKALNSLKLDGNELQVIESRIFRDQFSLVHLNLSNNRISQVGSGSFADLQTLKTLDLHSNDLKSFPEHVFDNLTELEVINLSRNRFTADQLPQNLFMNLSSLKTVFLSDNQVNLTTLPARFFSDLVDLKKIELSGSGLSVLPADLFTNVRNLHKLRLGRNYIEKLPKHIFQGCRSLIMLDLSSNLIADLPDGVFSKLSDLEVLDLSGNRIKTIRDNFFDGLSYLKELNMEHNGLENIHQNGLSSLSNLRIARFSFNQLTRRVFEMRPFKSSIKNVEELQLAHNNISDLSVILNDYVIMPKLRKLSLGHNHLETLTLYDLQFRNVNTRIDVSYNQIRSIQFRDKRTNEIGSFTQNLNITISNNPIVCDCHLHDLIRYRERRLNSSIFDTLHLEMDDLRCNEPDSLRGRAVSTLDPKFLKCPVQNPRVHNATCPEHCHCWLQPEDSVYLIDCSYRNLTSYPAPLKPPAGHKIELNLTGNFLISTPDMNSSGYDQVTSLILSRNRIQTIPTTIRSRNLRVLHLNSNDLSRLNLNTLDFFRNLSHLTLDDNSWPCDCQAINFIRFIQTQIVRVRSLEQVRCNRSSLLIFELRPDELCEQHVGWIIAAGVSIGFFGIVAGSTAALYYCYQYEIKVWLYAKGWCLSFLTEDDLDKDKPYDVFISYSHKDEDFVIKNLLPKLECGPEPFKLCVHYRDWIAGEWIPAQIARSVEDSKRTIIVVSPNFLQSVWGRLEFRAAHNQALSDGRARVIVVLYGEVKVSQIDTELKAYLTMNTYVKWGDPWFWDKLRYALPHPRRVVDKRKRRTTVEAQGLAEYVTSTVTDSAGHCGSTLII